MSFVRVRDYLMPDSGIEGCQGFPKDPRRHADLGQVRADGSRHIEQEDYG